MSAEEAVAWVCSGDNVYVGSNCGQPVTLCNALAARAHELSDVCLYHLLTFGPAPYTAPGMEGAFRHVAFFVAGNTRGATDCGRADYIPVFLSEIPGLFDSGQIPLDVALLAVSPPDANGECSLGVSVDLAVAALRNAKKVIAEVQPQMPRTCGPTTVNIERFDAVCEAAHPLLEHPAEAPDPTCHAIARNVAALVPDGACIQTGFGKLPSAVLEAFQNHNDLGLHTEMFSDQIVNLVHRGNINCSRKTIFYGKAVCTFALGTRVLFDEINENPFYEFHPTEIANDPFVISQNDSMAAINSAIEIDLTGQVVADSIGHRTYSGIGGQVDFIRGAARSRGGVPIIALPSTAKGGRQSRIVCDLTPGAGVVTSRGDVHWVVTEHGAANLHGKPVLERAECLIALATPEFRSDLQAQWDAVKPR